MGQIFHCLSSAFLSPVASGKSLESVWTDLTMMWQANVTIMKSPSFICVGEMVVVLILIKIMDS